MRLRRDVAQVVRDYPRIYLACHRRHVRDPRTGGQVSMRQVGILEHLDADTPTMLADLARHLGVTPATASIAVARLVALGYVTRVVDPVDRRKVQLRLTVAGAGMRAAASVLEPALVEAMLARLSDRDRKAALRGLALLGRAADDAQRPETRPETQAGKRAGKQTGKQQITNQVATDAGAAPQPRNTREEDGVRWMLIAALVALGAVAIVVVIGLLLPRDHVAAMSARIAGGPDAVWAALADPAGYPAWRADVLHVDLLPPVATGACWREHGKDGTITYVVEASDPPHRLITRIADPHLPFGGRWEYRIEPAGSHASIVTIVERGSVYNPVFRFVSRFFIGHTATIDAYLRALVKRFGGSDTPAVVAMELAQPR